MPDSLTAQRFRPPKPGFTHRVNPRFMELTVVQVTSVFGFWKTEVGPQSFYDRLFCYAYRCCWHAVFYSGL